MRRIYSCTLCDWVKIANSIVPFNVHVSTEHREFFFIDPKDSIRNDKRLRDYVRLDPIEKDRRKEYDRET